MLNISILVFMILAVVLFERSIATRAFQGKMTDHFNGKRFFNPGMPTRLPPEKKQNRSVWVWLLTRSRGIWKSRAITPTKPSERLLDGVRVTYVNHATVLVQVAGINIITDPVWARRASPLSFMGPARYADPGILFDDLPRIDIILISHNHYDHMDLHALRRLSKKWKPRMYAPLGNSSYLARKGISGVVDLDWWDAREDGSLTITAVPAQHFSARSFFDRNNTLWCGFVITTPLGNIYFAGDTGFGSFVTAIHERFSGFIVGLIPIGAYEPAWMMQPVHTNPEEALRIHEILHIETSIGIHHGTFRLTDEPVHEPRERIERNRGTQDFRVLENGEVFTR